MSKVYKLDRNVLQKSEILTTKPGVGGPEDDRFFSLDSLWQSSDTEYVDTVNRLKKEQEQVERLTREMLEKAKAQVDTIEKEAYDKGFKAGKDEALAEEKKKQQEMASQFDQLLQSFHEDRKRLHDHYELDILTLVKLMVDRVLYHEVTVNPLVIESCLKTAMSYVVQKSKVKINLNKDDLEKIQQAIVEKPELIESVSQVELTEDPAISLGGCFLETGFGEIDATLETRKDKIYHALDTIFVKALAGRTAAEAASTKTSGPDETAQSVASSNKYNDVPPPKSAETSTAQTEEVREADPTIVSQEAEDVRELDSSAVPQATKEVLETVSDTDHQETDVPASEVFEEEPE